MSHELHPAIHAAGILMSHSVYAPPAPPLPLPLPPCAAALDEDGGDVGSGVSTPSMRESTSLPTSYVARYHPRPNPSRTTHNPSPANHTHHRYIWAEEMLAALYSRVNLNPPRTFVKRRDAPRFENLPRRVDNVLFRGCLLLELDHDDGARDGGQQRAGGGAGEEDPRDVTRLCLVACREGGAHPGGDGGGGGQVPQQQHFLGFLEDAERQALHEPRGEQGWPYSAVQPTEGVVHGRGRNTRRWAPLLKLQPDLHAVERVANDDPASPREDGCQRRRRAAAAAAVRALIRRHVERWARRSEGEDATQCASLRCRPVVHSRQIICWTRTSSPTNFFVRMCMERALLGKSCDETNPAPAFGSRSKHHSTDSPPPASHVPLQHPFRRPPTHPR